MRKMTEEFLRASYAGESQELQVDRFLASQAILLSLAGVPGIYVHSLFGSRNWHEGVAQTGRNRTINRRKFERRELEAAGIRPVADNGAYLDRQAAAFNGFHDGLQVAAAARDQDHDRQAGCRGVGHQRRGRAA